MHRKNQTRWAQFKQPLVRGVTMLEVLCTAAVVGVVSVAAVPMLSSVDDAALVANSAANLRNLAAANETYSSDWSDRQFTTTPDDVGKVGGDGAQYLETIACPPPMLLGWSDTGMWGYFLAGGKCGDQYPSGSIGNWTAYLPLAFADNGAYGSFRLPNVKAFHDYINGRVYDSTFYAPKDEVALEKVRPHFESPFEYQGGELVESSYCFSPAALFDAAVFAAKADGIEPPAWDIRIKQPNAYRAPSVGQCRYPSLKTRMIEHNWLQNRPDRATNDFMCGAPWTFNQGIASQPLSLFFDGHIEGVHCERAMRDDSKTGGLWSRETPLGNKGYYGGQAFDGFVNTSFHILTTNGVEGRDILGNEATNAASRQVVNRPGVHIGRSATVVEPAVKAPPKSPE